MAEEKNAKVIYMLGIEKCDLLYFLTKIGENASLRILVIDNSKTKDMYRMYQEKGLNDFVTVRGITVGKNIRYFQEAKELYDYVFIYGGMNKINEQWYDKSDLRCLISSFEKLDRERIREILKDTDKDNIFIVFRDKATKKISETTVMNEYKLRNAEHISFPLYERDYATYVTMQENRDTSIKSVSLDMQDAIKVLMMKCYDMPEKNFKKYAK